MTDFYWHEPLDPFSFDPNNKFVIMENVLFFFLATGILIFLVVIRNEFLKKYEILNKNLHAIHKQIKSLQENEKEVTVEKPVNTSFTSLADIPVKDNSLDLSSQRLVIESAQEKSTVAKKEEKKTPPVEKVQQPKEEIPVKIVPSEKPVVETAPVLQNIISQKAKPIEPATTQSNTAPIKPATDFEKLIGENWLNKIGIAILVIGIGFFVKYAIDQNWINEIGRLSIGIAAALSMVGIAHWLRTKYHAFSSVLIGGGVATLYYTISIGYHDYRLFSQPVAFVIMTAITLFSTLMSVWYGRRELAIIGLIGGFTAPFMVAGNSNNAATFFTYIAILNSGMLLLSFFKKWNELNRLAFVFSTLYLTTWIAMNNLGISRNFNIALTFLILFFVQFLTMNLTYNIIKKVKFNAWEFIHLLSISAIFYGAILYTLHTGGYDDLKGVFTIALSTLFMMLTILLKRIPESESNLIFLISAKAVTFLTLTIFVQFDGHYTTLFWALEAVVLYWLGLRSKMNLLKNTSILVAGIATVSLFVVWTKNYQLSQGILPILTNTAFATGSFVLICYGFLIYLMRRDSEETLILGMGSKFFAVILQYWFFIAMYLVMLLEVVHQSQRIVGNEAEMMVIWLFHLIYLTTGLALSNWKGTRFVRQLFFGISALAMVLYLIAGNYFVILIRDGLFTQDTLNFFYQLHFVNVLLFAAMLVLMRKSLTLASEDIRHYTLFWLFASLVSLYLICAEMDHFAIRSFAESLEDKSRILRHTQIAGYTIVLGLYSFLMMIFGMRKKIRAIRIFSLVTFSITLFKLFVFDIRNISEGGKIIAFILLGVLLLVISFLYQKLKKMIVEG